MYSSYNRLMWHLESVTHLNGEGGGSPMASVVTVKPVIANQVLAMQGRMKRLGVENEGTCEHAKVVCVNVC